MISMLRLRSSSGLLNIIHETCICGTQVAEAVIEGLLLMQQTPQDPLDPSAVV
jgi:hypothetical protein